MENKEHWIEWRGGDYTGPENLYDDTRVTIQLENGNICNGVVCDFDWSHDIHLLQEDEHIVSYMIIKDEIEESPKKQEKFDDNPKYDKKLIDKYDNSVFIVGDVYTVLEAFDVRCPALQHAAKKILNPGKRGHKDVMEDLIDIKHSIDRAIELEKGR